MNIDSIQSAFNSSENSSREITEHPPSTHSILADYFQDIVSKSTSASTTTSLVTSPDCQRSVWQKGLTGKVALQLMLNTPRLESAVLDQATDEATLFEMNDDLLKECVDFLLNPGSTMTHLKISHLSVEIAWELLGHLRFRESNITTLSLNSLENSTIVILMNALIKSPNRIQKLNLLNLSPAETREILPFLLNPLNPYCVVTEIGFENCAPEALQELVPLLLDPDCKIIRLDLKNLLPEFVTQLLIELWEVQQIRTEKLIIHANCARWADLARTLDIFNNHHAVDARSEAAAVAQQPEQVVSEIAITSPLLPCTDSTDQAANAHRSKRKNIVSNSMQRHKKSKKTN